MGKVLVLRPGAALGDAIFVSPVPRLLVELGHEVHVACEKTAKPIFDNNPYVTEWVETPPAHKWPEFEPVYNRLVGNYDKIYHAHGHVEVGLLYRTDVIWGSIPTSPQRREIARGKSYQDITFEALGLTERGVLPEFHFTPEEEASMTELRAILDQDKKKLVVWQWEGSTQSKGLVWGPKYLRDTLDRFPDTVHYVFTDTPNFKAQIPKDERVYDAMGTQTVRQSIMLTRVADLVIGPESFIVNAAAAFDTPKIIFFSHSAPENLAKYYRNCQAVTPLPQVDCHPCYLIQVDFQRVYNPIKRGVCRQFEQACRVWDTDYVYRSLGYKCCYFLDHEDVMAKIERALG